MLIIKYRKIFFALAVILVGGSIATMVAKGFRIGVDFTGGSVLEVSYDNRPSVEAVKAHLLPVRTDAQVQEVGSRDLMIRTETVDQAGKDAMLKALSFDGSNATEKRFNTIGPSVGAELRSKALPSVIIVSLAIILFIAFGSLVVRQLLDLLGVARSGQRFALRIGAVEAHGGGERAPARGRGHAACLPRRFAAARAITLAQGAHREAPVTSTRPHRVQSPAALRAW